jgi:hypothetical protein
MGGLPFGVRDNLKVRHGDFHPVFLRAFSLLLYPPWIALLRFVPDHFPEIQLSEQYAPH